MATDGFSACGAPAQPAHKSVKSATNVGLNVLRFSVVFFMPQRSGASRFLLLLVGGILPCCCRGGSRYLFRGDSLNFEPLGTAFAQLLQRLCYGPTAKSVFLIERRGDTGARNELSSDRTTVQALPSTSMRALGFDLALPD